MWGDASIVGHGAAQKNPLRWSSARSIKETLEDLADHETQDAQRPVLMFFKDSVTSWTSRYENVTDAIEDLKNVTPPHSPSSLGRTDSLAQEERRRIDEVRRRRRLNQKQKPMCHIKENIARVIAEIHEEGRSLEDAENMLVEYRKIACNRGEELLHSMSALNGPFGMHLGGREKRKAALARLNALLDEVDAVRLDLVAFEKAIECRNAELVKEFVVVDVDRGPA